MVKSIRKLAIPMVFVFLTQTALPAPLVAEEQKALGVTQAQQTTISLEKAISIVKANFEVPKELTEFTSGYNNYNNRQVWSLNWHSSADTEGNFMAQVDVNTGEIINVNLWKPVKPGSGFNVPNYSYNQAKEIAQKLVNQLLGDRLDELEIIPENNQIIPLTEYGPINYTVQWKRVVNGVSFPSNGATVQVSGNDGTIMGYSLNWTRENFPAKDAVIGEEKAREAIEKNKLLELQYFVPPIFRPLSSAEKTQAQLVYQLNSSYNGAIDALTGEPLKLNPGEWLSTEQMADGRGGYAGANKSAAEAPLTPEEQKEVEKNAQLISQEKAIEAVKKWVEIPADLTLRNANLGADGPFNQSRVWSFDWNSKQTDKENYQYIFARVDAVTGEVLGFHTASSYRGDEKPQTIDRATAQSLAEEFLKKIQPNRFNEVKLMEAQDMGMKYSADSVLQDFRYQRLVNGVPFPSNGFTVSIDTATKKVIGFEMNWWALDFPGTTDMLSEKQAYDTFFAGRPLTLKYVQIYKNGLPGEIRLVYQPSNDNPLTNSNCMDAKTGKFLSWEGKPLTELPRPYSFTDISGNFAEKEISLLGQAGVFGEYGNEFKPNENITVKSMLRAMLIAKNGAWVNLTDKDVLKQVKELGWWKEDLGLEQGVNRELLAKLMIRMLQLEKIAQIDGLFQAPYDDTSALSSGSMGYVALTKGLGIIKIDGTNFEPAKGVTRADAAYAIVKALGAKR